MCVCKYQSNIYQRGHHSKISEVEFAISIFFSRQKRLLSMYKSGRETVKNQK